MPRAPVPGKEIRRRSRTGCWNCKARKVKCGEEKPRCSNCQRLGDDCDYKLRLSWGGRPLKKKQLQNGTQDAEDDSMFLPGAGQFSINNPPHTGSSTVSPQNFSPAPTNYGNGPPRKPRPPKKTGMSSYQNVFSVADVSAPSAPGGINSSTASTVNGDTTPQPLQSPPSTASNSSPSQLQQTPSSWQSLQQHVTTKRESPSQGVGRTTIQSSGNPANTGKAPNVKFEPQDFGMGSFVPMSTTFNPAISTAHTESFPGGLLPVRSPTSPRGPDFGSMPPSAPVMSLPSSGLSSPHSTQNPMGVNAPPPTPSYPKDYRPPPLDLARGDWKRIRTNISPTINPVSYFSAADSFLPMPSLAPVANFPSFAFAQAPITNFGMQATAVPPPSNTAVRRVSVEHLLSEPLADMYPNSYADGISNEDPFAVDPQQAFENGEDEDDVEEIERSDFGFGGSFQNPMAIFQANGRNAIRFPEKISIPRALEPLPSFLLNNKTNKQYFFHFTDETARLLVPHDCERNPFRQLLPKMAVQTEPLLNLLLAYSASHRARLLEQPEPTGEISEFLDYTVKSLSKALSDPNESTSDLTLATAIMLCSYEIISPNAFNTTWQTHLSAARQILINRPPEKRFRRDPFSFFLIRWFAYLDVLGSLSGERSEPLIPDYYWADDPSVYEEPHEVQEMPVDCVLGFTTRCVAILAKIGELSRQCEQLRGNTNPKDWSPPADILVTAESLRVELEDAKARASDCCVTDPVHAHSHMHHNPLAAFGGAPSSPKSNSPSELISTNIAFHCAALVHLYRRVYFYPREAPEVQSAAMQIVEAFKGIARGGNAENCSLFPLFTAGCEVLDENARSYVRERMQGLEKIGMMQFGRAREIMERVWREGQSWDEVVGKEFIG